MAAEARDERVEVRQPGKGPASVILSPVPLLYLVELVAPENAGKRAGERRCLAEGLVEFRHSIARADTTGINNTARETNYAVLDRFLADYPP